LLAGDGGHLVTQAFAPACGHEYQRVAPGNNVFHDGLLRPAELRIAKNVVKNLMVGH
jgi:hypothetical protein